MASRLPEQSTRNFGSKPLNPKAEPFFRPIPKTSHPQLGHPWSHGLLQIPPLMPFRPIHTYHPHCFGYLSLTACYMGVAARLAEYKTEEHMGERMIADTQRPPKSRCMSRKGRRPAISARREHENRWNVGNNVLRGDNTSDGHPIVPFPATMEECNRSRTSTVMIKNVPYHFQFKDLISILDEHCSQQNQSSRRASSLSMYDFVYLPMDYKKFANANKQSNLGYAFVNFTTARAAFLFFQLFNGKKWPGNENWKVCEVAKAQIQGKEALMRKFKEKVFRCVHPSFRPVEFRPARDGANNDGIKEISVGRFEKGEGCLIPAKPRTLRNQ